MSSAGKVNMTVKIQECMCGTHCVLCNPDKIESRLGGTGAEDLSKDFGADTLLAGDQLSDPFLGL